jgi:molecular chaperone HtpG
VRALAQTMSLLIRPGGTGRLRVEARRFEPVTLPAVLKHTETGGGAMKARDILSDPNAPSDLRAMAEDMLRMARNADMRMSINAANPLIRTLAELIGEAPEDPDLIDLTLGVYNDAILYNQELMTPTNARLFHEQFQRLMARSLEFVRQKAEIARRQAELERERRARAPADGPPRTHLVAFLMTPFAPEFERPREAIRRIIEDQYGCELLTADKRTFDDFIHGNVDAHLRDADLFLADVTGANPNVMMELGAAIYGAAPAHGGAPGRTRPRLLVAAADGADAKPELPADLAGHITARYPRDAEPAAIAQALAREFAKHQPLKALLERPGRERFLSPATLRGYVGAAIQLPEAVFARLSEALPTDSRWHRATDADLAPLLGAAYEDLAPSVLKRVRTGLDQRGAG